MSEDLAARTLPHVDPVDEGETIFSSCQDSWCRDVMLLTAMVGKSDDV